MNLIPSRLAFNILAHNSPDIIVSTAFQTIMAMVKCMNNCIFDIISLLNLKIKLLFDIVDHFKQLIILIIIPKLAIWHSQLKINLDNMWDDHTWCNDRICLSRGKSRRYFSE